MTGGARTNGCSEQKAEDGRSFHRLSDGAITILLRSTSLRLGTCATFPDEVCRSGLQSQNGRAPKAAYSGEARLSACTSLVENQIRELRQVAGRRDGMWSRSIAMRASQRQGTKRTAWP